MNLQLGCDRLCTLNLCQICVPVGVKQIGFSVCSIFDLGGMVKYLVADPNRNSELCFPSTVNAPPSFSHKNKIHCFPLGPVIKKAQNTII